MMMTQKRSDLGGLRRRGRNAAYGLAMGLALVTALAAQGHAVQTVPFGTATGGITVYYNNNAVVPREQPANQAYLRAQFTQTNINGAGLTFSNAALPPPGNPITWYNLFSNISPSQFGLDLIVPAPTTDSSVTLPTLIAKDNVNGTPGGATPAGSVTWAINDYKGGSPSGPQLPGNAVTNSLFRGGTGVGDGLTLEVQSLSNPTPGVWTMTVAGELLSDGIIHWYTPSTPDSPTTNFELTGKFFYSGTLTYNTATDLVTGSDFYAGTIDLTAEVVCADRFVNATTGLDTLPGPTPNNCRNAGVPCRTINYAVARSCSGDTVNVAPGTYAEQVRISKSLNLVGAGAASTTIVAPAKASRAKENADMGFGLRTYDYLVGVFGTGAETVNISGFKLDGNNDANSSGPVIPPATDFRSQQLALFNASGTMQDNVLVDWQDPAAFGAQGVATLVSGSLTPVTVRVLNNVVTGYQKGGIVAHGTAASTVTIDGNTVTGAGPISTTAQNGIQMGYGAVGTISNNVVHDNYYAPATWCSAGILILESDGVIVQDNIMSGSLCDFITSPTNGSTISGNVINPAGIYPFTIIGNDNIVSGNLVNGSSSVGVYVDGIGNSFSCNRVTNNVGGGFWFDSNGPGGYGSTSGVPNTVSSNIISGNGVGVDGSVVVGGSIAATGNWWGCSGGPAGGAGCDTITANVDELSPLSAPPVCVSCTGTPDGSACNDGTFCNGGDTCLSGSCTGHAGDPCAAGPECGNVCNEAADNCVVLQSTHTVCRPSVGQCDLPEECDGVAVTCPANLFVSAATHCAGASQGGACNDDAADHCSGSDNSCVDVFKSNTTVCRASAGQCDVAETCTGTSGVCPADSLAPSSTHCTGASQGGLCDNNAGDHCTGTSPTACVDVFKPSSTVCRASAGQCDVAESCTGSSGACPADVFASSATHCTGTSQGGACDNDAADHCTGTVNSCVDVFQSSSTQCRAPDDLNLNPFGCDLPVNCTGTGGPCPASSSVCSVHDNFVVLSRPLTFAIPATKAHLATRMLVAVRNADITRSGGATVQLVASSEDCPSGTIVGVPDFGRLKAGAQDTVWLGPGAARAAIVSLDISRDGFTTHNRLAPNRCTLTFTVNTVLPAHSEDPTPKNNSNTVELNVIDSNDPAVTSAPPHETLIRSMGPLSLGLKKSTPPRSLSFKYPVVVINADYKPSDADTITVSVDSGDCPPGLFGAGVVDWSKLPGVQDSVTLTGGRAAAGLLPMTIDPSEFSPAAGQNVRSPTRCTAIVRASGPSGIGDADPTNDSTKMVIDVYDTNDFDRTGNPIP